MALFELNPITKKRWDRFKRIKRGYYSLMVLLVAVVLSLFSNFIANNRPILMKYNGELYFPTFKFHDKESLGQDDIYGLTDTEADYRSLKKEWEGTENWLILAPIPYNPLENDFTYDDPPPNPPDHQHLLGTDSQGRDVLARLIYGFRISIFFSLILVFLGETLGVVIGSMQGFLGGWLDILSQRFIEVWSSLPFLYIVVIMSTIFVPSFKLLLVVMLAFQWLGITYYMRTEMYREKTREYCLAAQSFGSGKWRIMFKHLLPNCLTPLVTNVPFAIVGGISALTGLDYLGYGLPAPTPSWGELFEQALKSENRDKLWLVMSPFTAVVSTLLLVTLIGESVREAFDPKQYARYE
jgi:microcin C transport system permease protein